MVSFLFIGLVVTILLTPGPTNTLLASAGIQAGVKHSLKLIPAEVIGYLIAITSWGVLLESVSHFIPWLPAILKLMSAGFILYLAFKLWMTSSEDIKLDRPLITPKALFLATLLNPKALLLLQQFFHMQRGKFLIYILFTLLSFIFNYPNCFLWIMFGTVLISNKVTWLNQRNLQRIAAFILTFSPCRSAIQRLAHFRPNKLIYIKKFNIQEFFMKRLKVVIKDQFDQESIALAKVRPANDQKLELYKSVEHIEIDDDIILPNMDLLYENPKDGKIYKLVGPFNEDEI